MATWEVEAMFFFAKYNLNLPYIYPIFSSQKIIFSYIIFVFLYMSPYIFTLIYVLQLQPS
jgi:hypothetical protein